MNQAPCKLSVSGALIGDWVCKRVALRSILILVVIDLSIRTLLSASVSLNQGPP